MSQNSEVKADKIINASGEVTGGGGGTVLYQEKFLSADLTANATDIADLKFSNLEIGKTYKVSVMVFGSFQQSTGSGVFLSAIHGIGNPGVKLNIGMGTALVPTSAEVINFRVAGNRIFVATQTTLTFNASVGGSNAEMVGGADTFPGITRVQLEELPDHSATTQWN